MDLENGPANEREKLLPRQTHSNSAPYMDGLDVSSQRSIERSESMKGSTISFHGISYLVNTKEDGKKIQKVILNDITGIFGPGMNAILGPTGSGKTSLLDVLAARKDPSGLSGLVLIDGQAQCGDFRLASGYVVQEDVVMGTLTVRENLEFSANLRLSGAVSKRERKNRVDDVINELGLNLCAETKPIRGVELNALMCRGLKWNKFIEAQVGTEFIRGISGGERKRTNVGLELITKPSILFLDEPTTGLDASTANAVMILLSRLTKRGRTIIFSIHQPRYSIYKLFDKLHLLSLGNTVYHGPVNEALPYFLNIGYVCEEHNNPPDFFLDIINGDSKAVTMAEEDIRAGVHDKTAIDVQPNRDTISDQISRLFKNSQENGCMMDTANQIFKEFQAKDAVSTSSITYPSSFLTQLYYVSKRTVLNIIRNPLQSYFQFVFLVIFGLVVGGLYFQLDLSPAGLQNRVGAFFFLIMNMIFSNLSAIELFIKERIIYVHESASGYYRCSSYYFAKVFCDLLPMRIFPTIVFSSITYWMIGFKRELVPFLIYCLTLSQTTITASALSFGISSSVSIMAVGTLILSAVFVFMMIFGGLLLNISTLPSWLQWLQYFSIFRFSLNALLVNELVGLDFCVTLPNGTEIHCESGTDYLDQQGIDHTTWGLWKNEVALAGLSLLFFLLAYIQLRRIRKLK